MKYKLRGDSVVEKSFKKIFWGYLFLLINLRIMGFDILPDFIGYIIILFGVRELSTQNEYFAKAVNMNYILIFLSLFGIYEVTEGLGVQPNGLNNPITFILGIVSIIVDLYFMYNLFMGIRDMSDERNIIDLYNKSDDYWGYYWKLTVATFIGILFAFIPVIGLIYLLIIVVLFIVLQINILRFFWDCSNRFIEDINVE